MVSVAVWPQEVAETATKLSPVSYQKHSLGVSTTGPGLAAVAFSQQCLRCRTATSGRHIVSPLFGRLGCRSFASAAAVPVLDHLTEIYQISVFISTGVKGGDNQEK